MRSDWLLKKKQMQIRLSSVTGCIMQMRPRHHLYSASVPILCTRRRHLLALRSQPQQQKSLRIFSPLVSTSFIFCQSPRSPSFLNMPALTTQSSTSSPTPVPPTPPPAPHALTCANVTILGGGPVATLAAILLAYRRIPVTLITAATNIYSQPPETTAPILLDTRTTSVLRSVPHLYPRVAAFAQPLTSPHVVTLHADSTISKTPLCPTSPAPTLSILHADLQRVLATFVAEYNIRVYYGITTTIPTLHPDGTVALTLHAGPYRRVIRSLLVLACEPRDASALLFALRIEAITPRSHISTSAGLSDQYFRLTDQPLLTRPLHLRSVVRNFVATAMSGDQLCDNACIALSGEQWGGPDNRMFSLVAPPLPTVAADVACEDGVVAIVVARPEAPVLQTSDVDSAFALFAENFPQVDVRAIIGRAAMARFVAVRQDLRMQIASRPASLAVIVGRGEGGVVFVGDMARSLPPDLGESLNVGMEDLAEFMQIVDSVGLTGQIEGIVDRYDKARNCVTDGFMLAMREGILWRAGMADWKMSHDFERTVQLGLQKKQRQRNEKNNGGASPASIVLDVEMPVKEHLPGTDSGSLGVWMGFMALVGVAITLRWRK